VKWVAQNTNEKSSGMPTQYTKKCMLLKHKIKVKKERTFKEHRIQKIRAITGASGQRNLYIVLPSVQKGAIICEPAPPVQVDI
jgi:hypothetical protein